MAGPKYVKEFEYPRSAGFTGSADHAEGLRHVRGYNRHRPGFAKGGVVRTSDDKEPKKEEPKKEEPKKEERISTLDALRGKGRKQQEKDLGLKRGGAAKKYARGGAVSQDTMDSATIRRSPNSTTQRDAEVGGKGPLTPGFKRGGRTKAMGGPVKYARGGDVKQDKAMIASALKKHVNTPAPKGHKGLKSC